MAPAGARGALEMASLAVMMVWVTRVGAARRHNRIALHASFPERLAANIIHAMPVPTPCPTVTQFRGRCCAIVQEKEFVETQGALQGAPRSNMSLVDIVAGALEREIDKRSKFYRTCRTEEKACCRTSPNGPIGKAFDMCHSMCIRVSCWSRRRWCARMCVQDCEDLCSAAHINGPSRMGPARYPSSAAPTTRPLDPAAVPRQHSIATRVPTIATAVPLTESPATTGGRLTGNPVSLAPTTMHHHPTSTKETFSPIAVTRVLTSAPTTKSPVLRNFTVGTNEATASPGTSPTSCASLGSTLSPFTFCALMETSQAYTCGDPVRAHWVRLRQALHNALLDGRRFASVSIRGSLDKTGILCSSNAKAQQIASLFAAGLHGSVACDDGNVWYVGTGCSLTQQPCSPFGFGVSLRTNIVDSCACVDAGPHTRAATVRPTTRACPRARARARVSDINHNSTNAAHFSHIRRQCKLGWIWKVVQRRPSRPATRSSLARSVSTA